MQLSKLCFLGVFFKIFCMWMCLLDFNLSLYLFVSHLQPIPILYKKHPIWRKNTQFAFYHNLLKIHPIYAKWAISSAGGRGKGHSPEKGVWGCTALKTPFSRLTCRTQDPQLRLKSVHKTLIWMINVKSKSKVLENMAIFSSRSSILAPIFIQNLRNLINDQFSSTCFWWKSAHKPPIFMGIHSRSQAPKFRGGTRLFLVGMCGPNFWDPLWKKTLGILKFSKKHPKGQAKCITLGKSHWNDHWNL